MNYTKAEYNEFRFKAEFINSILRKGLNIELMTDEEVASFYHENVKYMPTYDSETGKDKGIEKMAEVSKNIADKSDIAPFPIILSTSNKGWYCDYDFLKLLKESIQGSLENDVTIEDLDSIIIAMVALAEQIALLKR